MINLLDPFIIPPGDQSSDVDQKALLISTQNEIKTKISVVKELIEEFEGRRTKVTHPLVQLSTDSESTSTVGSDGSGGGGLVKRFKIKIKPPTPSQVDPVVVIGGGSGNKTLPRVGYGVKNLARAKELSRLQSSTLKVTSGSSEFAKQRENQIPVNFFWSFIEPFFSSISESDLKILKGKELDESLFIIPRPTDQLHRSSSTAIASPTSTSMEGLLLDDDKSCSNLFQSESNFKLLSMRIITLFVEENLINIEEEQELLRSSSNLSPKRGEEEEELPDEIIPNEKKTAMSNDQLLLENIPDLQNRIMQELSFINLPSTISQKDSSHSSPIVDDSFRELKCLQYCLRAIHAVNGRRRDLLHSFLRARMASLEYYSILDELDKQIEHSYSKKYKILKKKKRNLTIDIPTECPELEGLLGKRAALVKNFSSIVMPRNQVSIPISNELFMNPSEEGKIASRFEIPTLSDEETRKLFGIEKIVEDSKIFVWPSTNSQTVSSSSSSSDSNLSEAIN